MSIQSHQEIVAYMNSAEYFHRRKNKYQINGACLGITSETKRYFGCGHRFAYETTMNMENCKYIIKTEDHTKKMAQQKGLIGLFFTLPESYHTEFLEMLRNSNRKTKRFTSKTVKNLQNMRDTFLHSYKSEIKIKNRSPKKQKLVRIYASKMKNEEKIEKRILNKWIKFDQKDLPPKNDTCIPKIVKKAPAVQAKVPIIVQDKNAKHDKDENLNINKSSNSKQQSQLAQEIKDSSKMNTKSNSNNSIDLTDLQNLKFTNNIESPVTTPDRCKNNTGRSWTF